MGSLQDRCAIVTGGAGGLGRAIVSGLLENSANVLVVDVDENALDQFESTVKCS